MGPLNGVKIVELAAIGPAPMCGMLLADLGATVLRIERLEPSGLGVARPIAFNLIMRNRETIALDLKAPHCVDLVLDLVETADALIEGFRPGVAERLGLGPQECLERNPALVYGRVTGWGQDGPLAHAAGHDLNYIALAGALAAIGRSGQLPAPPLNMVGDFAGGALFLAVGVLSALLEARRSGKGQVVDAAIADGVATMMMPFFGLSAADLWSEARGENVLDSGAPFYDVYACADGALVSLAPIEDKFFALFLNRVGLPEDALAMKADRARWPELRALLAETFARHPRDHWCDLLEGTDACFAPVLTMADMANHPHMRARGVVAEIAGVRQPVPAPRFSRTRPATPRPPANAKPEDYESILRRWLPPDRVGLALERAEARAPAKPRSAQPSLA